MVNSEKKSGLNDHIPTTLDEVIINIRSITINYKEYIFLI